MIRYGSQNRSFWNNYFAQSTKADEDGWYPVANMDVTIPSEEPIPDASLLPKASSTSVSDINRREDTHYSLNRALRATHSNEGINELFEQQTETPQMFVHRPGVIKRMTADPDMRHSAGSLLGMLYEDAQRNKWTLVPDASLSRHSSKLVQRGLRAGILRPNPNNPTGTQSNTLDFSMHRVPDFEMFERWGVEERDPDDVKKSTDALIERVSRRPKHLSTQFNPPEEPEYEQLTLDGF